jgi:hypothetical protein
MGAASAIAVLVLSVLVLAGLLLMQRRKAHDTPVGAVPSWRQSSLRQNLRQHHALVVAVAGLTALTAAVLVIWVLPAVLTRHPHIADAADRQKAITDTRTGLVAGLAALGAAGGLAYTARTYRLSREGQITDRYSKAVEQLGSDKIAVQLGGIYALERLMRDSASDRPTIMATLAAYVRQHAPRDPRLTVQRWDHRVAGRDQQGRVPSREHPSEDVQAILTVLGRRPGADAQPVNLASTDLAGSQLEDANLSNSRLDNSSLISARLGKANLANAQLLGADLTDARLAGADLSNAWLGEARLRDARLGEANMTGARLVSTDLTNARLGGADLSNAHLGRALLVDAWLLEANLTNASFAGTDMKGAWVSTGALTGEQLASAKHVDAIRWVDWEE